MDYVRPQTPQALLHCAPDKPDSADAVTKPSKYIILLLAPTSVAGKVQIATLVSKALACPLYQGDSLHESSARAALVGASRSNDGGKGRYQRMWLSKMTRTGLLFPEESKPATEGFSGFGGSSSSTSRRGSASSMASTTSSSGASIAGSTGSSAFDAGNQSLAFGSPRNANQYINQPVFSISDAARDRKSNPALMVLTHPEVEVRHRDAIREAVGEYGIGVIFVPLFKTDVMHDAELEEEEEVPMLRPLDLSILSQITSFDEFRSARVRADTVKLSKYGKGKAGNLEEEMSLVVDIGGSADKIAEEVGEGVRDVMSARD